MSFFIHFGLTIFFYLFTFLFTFIFVLNSGVHIVMLVWLQVSEIGVLPQCGGKGTPYYEKNLDFLILTSLLLSFLKKVSLQKKIGN